MLVNLFRERACRTTQIPLVSEGLLESIGEVSLEFRREMESILNQYGFKSDICDTNEPKT